MPSWGWDTASCIRRYGSVQASRRSRGGRRAAVAEVAGGVLVLLKLVGLVLVLGVAFIVLLFHPFGILRLLP